MHRLIFCTGLITCMLNVNLVTAETVDPNAGPGEQAYQAWRSSHHYQAMLPANPDNVLGAFDGRRFEYGGITSRFFRSDERYMVETDDAKEGLAAFKEKRPPEYKGR